MEEESEAEENSESLHTESESEDDLEEESSPPEKYSTIPLSNNEVKKMPVESLAPSEVMKFCNRGFEEDSKRILRKRSREDQVEKAKYFSLNNLDQDGFKKLFIPNLIEGFGVFTTRAFSKGQYLLTYFGDLYSADDCDDTDEPDNSSTFRFYFTDYYKNKKRDLCVDANNTEGLCKYVNDSPKEYANCKMSRICDDQGRPFLCLFATIDIPEGYELRYDYGEKSKRLWWRRNKDCERPLDFKKLLRLPSNGIEPSL